MLYNRLMSGRIGEELVWALQQYDHLKERGYNSLLEQWPRFGNFNYFERFILLNILIIGLYLVCSCIGSFSLKGVYRRLMKWVFDLPPIRKFIFAQLRKAREDMLKARPDELKVHIEKVPFKTPIVDLGDASERETLKGKSSGTRYAAESHSKFVTNLSKHFAYTNPLHADTFPFVKQMEIEVITMTAEFIGLKNEEGRPCGLLNSGGTESIIMALYAYREFKMKESGVELPNLVICETGHAAAIKACHYFNIEVRIVPCDSNYQMHFRKMKAAIDSNTICVYTSYPNYPIGTVDQIELIAPYCRKRGVPVHVDMCLGGFVAPFQDSNWALPQGVTSVSADPHKYGLSGKGVSVILFSSEKYRRQQFFVTQYWPGGLYGTPGLAGSRSGVFIASAWVSMMKLGRKGYEENAKLIKNTLTKVSEELTKLGFEILNKQQICVLSFRHKTIPVNAIWSFMKKKGWGFTLTVKPMSFQFSFTPLNCQKSDEMIRDMKECLEDIAKNGYPKKEASELAIYGAFVKVKDHGKKTLVVSSFLDTCIDLC